MSPATIGEGYRYDTLEGHFERGQITFSVHKLLTSGRVFFRIHAYSQPEHIENPFYRLGFKVFGRSLQRRFAEQSLERVRLLVQAAPLTPRRTEPPRHVVVGDGLAREPMETARDASVEQAVDAVARGLEDGDRALDADDA